MGFNRDKYVAADGLGLTNQKIYNFLVYRLGRSVLR